jgi:uncharacterized protein (TIGR02284 family)
MVTTVGMETSLDELLEDLITLDHDAADAYQAAIERIENASRREPLTRFREDHLRHTRELGDLLAARGRTPPEGGDVKSLLTTGKVAIAGLAGDDAILEAMRTNEADTNTAYERALAFEGIDAATRQVFERGLADERRHCAWILEQLGR